MEQKQKGANFGIADGFMSDGTPVYIQTRPGESPSPLQLQIYAHLTGTTPDVQSLHPRMTVHPWDSRSPEAILGKLIEKESL